MTGWRWEKISIARIPGERIGARVAALAIGALLSFAYTASSATGLDVPPRLETAPAAVAATAEKSPLAVRSMGISAESGAVRLSFESRGELVHRLSSDSGAPVTELRLENAVFEGLSSKVEIGDGILDSVEFRSDGKAGVIALRTALPTSTEFVAREGGFDLLVRPTAKVAEAATAPVSAPKVLDVRVDAGRIEFDLGGAPDAVNGFLLSDGVRLVVDVSGVDLAKAELVKEFEGAVAKVAVRQADNQVRAVIEARDRATFAGYRLEKTERGFAICVPSVQTAAAKSEGEATVLAEVVASEAKPAGGGAIVDFGFHQDETRSFVDLSLSKPGAYEVTEATGTRVVLDIRSTSLPQKYQRALDTSAFNGPVRLVAAYGRGADTRVVIDLKEAVPFKVEPRENGFSIAFEGGSRKSAVPAGEPAPEPKEKIVLVPEGGVAPAGSAAPAAGESAVIIEGVPVAVEPTAVSSGKYKGQRISMDFVDADIRNVLRLIGDVAGFNMVAGSEVTGKITLRLIDVPWDQALDVILKAKGLDKDMDGNVMRIVAADKIAAERAQKEAALAAAAKAKEDATPLKSDIFPVSYAKASEILDKIKTVLSPRGDAKVDERTNTILIRDLPEKIELARELVARLDTPTPQVLIEARIVEVSSTYSEDLGVQWGGSFTADAAHGNAPGYSFPNSVGLKGDTGLSNYAVNLPVTAGSAGSAGAALALSLGSINDVIGLDLRIAALETAGKGRVVSSPRVTTLDNKAAEISQGIEIPFTTATNEKIETQSIDYLLKLMVTPHVTSDNSVMLRIDLKKDAPSTTFFSVDSSTPAKETRTATTEVLVRDGETTVIGGIITDTTSEKKSGVPWFHKIPFIGWMFQNTSNRVDKTELIIFITPKIIRVAETARSL